MLMSKVNVVSGSLMCTTHRLMVTYPCVKYSKPMSNQIKVMGRTRICTDRRRDRQTNRQSDSYIPPWTSFTGVIMKCLKFFVQQVRIYEISFYSVFMQYNYVCMAIKGIENLLNAQILHYTIYSRLLRWNIAHNEKGQKLHYHCHSPQITIVYPSQKCHSCFNFHLGFNILVNLYIHFEKRT